MKQQWQQWCKRFVELSQRERLMIAATAIVAVVLLGFTLLLEPALDKLTKAQQQTANAERESQQLERQLGLLDAQLQTDPDAKLRSEQQQIDQQIAEIQQGLQAQLVDLVVPEQMAASLAALLGQADGVSLIKLEIKDSEALTEQGGLYRHGVMLELEGNFFDLQRTLTRMEQMQRQFYWRHFSYRVTDYPLARLRLHLDTLGTEQEPIRVGYYPHADAGVAR